MYSIKLLKKIKTVFIVFSFKVVFLCQIIISLNLSYYLWVKSQMSMLFLEHLVNIYMQHNSGLIYFNRNNNCNSSTSFTFLCQ